MSILLSPFRLLSPLKAGGQGVVWRGVHDRSQVPVAVKVITASHARNPRYCRDFRFEVQAAARLSHPHVVVVLDYGQISDAAEAASDGELVAGSPYLVMEYAPDGSLGDSLLRPFQWEELRRILFALLDALAHAHAHGLIHRDLKPGNVLLIEDEHGALGPKLSDFGIAHASERELGEHTAGHTMYGAVVGTPYYMAPEQLHGRWRDYGPWTDLYALGIMAFQLINGDVPFKGSSLLEVANRHLNQELPPLKTPSWDLPSGLQDWLRKLTAKRPEQRFRRAADAAWQLSQLKPPTRAVGPLNASPHDVLGEPRIGKSNLKITATAHSAPIDETPRRAQTIIELATAFDTLGVETFDEEAPAAASLTTDGETTTVPLAIPRLPFPAVPPDNRNTQVETKMLLGAGLGLYALRTVPMVNRDAEREQLWTELGLTHASGKPRAVLLRGQAGCGKTRLAEWLCSRAHHAGVATGLKARHDAGQGPGHGLPNMVARHFQCVGLPQPQVLIRLEALLRDLGEDKAYEWEALSELVTVRTVDRDTATSIRFGSPRERYLLLQRVVTRIARRRTVVMLLDDVHWDSDSLAFVQHLLEQDTDAPILMLLTLHDDALRERDLERQQVGRLCERGDVSELRIPPLTEADSSSLVERLLHLSGSLAEDVVRRVDGNPLFAVRLVGDWVQRGVLEVGEGGFVLSPSATVELPDDIHQLWRPAIEQVLTGLSQAAQSGLELAAALGREVASDELRESCRLAQAQFPETLLDRLVARQLAFRTQGGFAFSHSMLCESLGRSSREAGRWPGLHLACDQMLKARYSAAHPGTLTRRARHLMVAGDVESALVMFENAARAFLDVSELALAARLVERRAAALSMLKVGAHDERRAVNWVLRADIARRQREFHEARRWAERALNEATSYQWDAVLDGALTVLAHVARNQGDLARANELNEQVLARFKERGEQLGIAQTVLAMAIIARLEGNAIRAMGLYERARGIFEEVGHRYGAGSCVLGLGHVHRQQRQYVRAGTLYALAETIFTDVGNRLEVANCKNGLAEIARYRGALEVAERSYREALDIIVAIGSGAGTVTRLNLVLILMRRGHYSQARDELVGLLSTMQRRGQKAFLPAAHAMLVTCAAALDDMEALDSHLETVRPLLDQTGTIDADIGECFGNAGAALASAGRVQRARDVYQLALSQWQALGEEARAQDTKACLLALVSGG